MFFWLLFEKILGDIIFTIIKATFPITIKTTLDNKRGITKAGKANWNKIVATGKTSKKIIPTPTKNNVKPTK